MFVRLVFLLLFALNLGAAAWLLFGRAPARPLPPVTDPGVPALKLLPGEPPAARVADTPASPAAAGTAANPVAAGTAANPVPAGTAAGPAAAGTSATTLRRDVCHTLGPFTTSADMRAAMQTLSPHVARIQYREQNMRTSRGFWVYLPRVASREAALDEARQLRAKGIHDYYVVTAGDQQNTISLGLFNDEANARKRLAALQKLGFNARVEQRFDTEPAYWIDYAVPAGSTFTWTDWLPGRSDLQRQAIDCF